MERDKVGPDQVRAQFPIPDRRWYGELFSSLIVALGGDAYGAEFTNATFEMHRYCWCEEDDCPQCGRGEQANFLYKPTDFRMTWYKYPLRSANTNQPVNPVSFREMIDACIASLSPEQIKQAIPHTPERRVSLDRKLQRNGRYGKLDHHDKPD